MNHGSSTRQIFHCLPGGRIGHMHVTLLSLLSVTLLAPSLAMGNDFPFPQRSRTAADAVILEHAAKRLAAQQAGADTPLRGAPPKILEPDEIRIRTRLSRLKQSIDRYRDLARRQAGHQILHEEFRQLSHAFADVEAMAQVANSPLTRGHLREDWFQLQQAFDQAYFDHYGFDALDPYFGRHPDFAAWPETHFHPRDYWRPRSAAADHVPAFHRFIDETEQGRHWSDTADALRNQPPAAIPQPVGQPKMDSARQF
ncbi:MAG: hypothetical protein WD045_10770 [Pirellulaceae bacterium]